MQRFIQSHFFFLRMLLYNILTIIISMKVAVYLGLVKILSCLSHHSIMDEKEFEWESQLRFYWMREPDELYIRQCTGIFLYGYEYMGLNGRLVITPLTDRIYLTLTQVCLLHRQSLCQQIVYLCAEICSRTIHHLHNESKSSSQGN